MARPRGAACQADTMPTEGLALVTLLETGLCAWYTKGFEKKGVGNQRADRAPSLGLVEFSRSVVGLVGGLK